MQEWKKPRAGIATSSHLQRELARLAEESGGKRWLPWFKEIPVRDPVLLARLDEAARRKKLTGEVEVRLDGDWFHRAKDSYSAGGDTYWCHGRGPLSSRWDLQRLMKGWKENPKGPDWKDELLLRAERAHLVQGVDEVENGHVFELEAIHYTFDPHDRLLHETKRWYRDEKPVENPHEERLRENGYELDKYNLFLRQIERGVTESEWKENAHEEWWRLKDPGKPGPDGLSGAQSSK